MRKDLGAKPLMYPQLVAIIGTYSEDGTPDAMNAAWGGIADYDKIFLCLGSHRTTDNMRRTGAFTVSVADEAHVAAADYVGIVSANKVPDKVARAGLTPIRSQRVDAPLFEEFPLALECELVEENDYGVIGRIVNVSVDERVLDAQGKVDTDKLAAISFDPINAAYLRVGGRVGSAFADGKQLMQGE